MLYENLELSTNEHSELIAATYLLEENQFILAASFSVFVVLTAIHITRAPTLKKSDNCAIPLGTRFINQIADLL